MAPFLPLWCTGAHAPVLAPPWLGPLCSWGGDNLPSTTCTPPAPCQPARLQVSLVPSGSLGEAGCFPTPRPRGSPADPLGSDPGTSSSVGTKASCPGAQARSPSVHLLFSTCPSHGDPSVPLQEPGNWGNFTPSLSRVCKSSRTWLARACCCCGFITLGAAGVGRDLGGRGECGPREGGGLSGRGLKGRGVSGWACSKWVRPTGQNWVWLLL